MSGKVPGVDEIRPKMQKALDIVEMSWLTCLFSVAWRLPMDWQIGLMVPIFKNGD